MKALFWLAQRGLRHHPWRHALLMVCLAAVVYIPWVGSELLQRYDRDLNQRASATPLVIGQRGNHYDLCLGALFFRKAALPPLTWSDYLEHAEGVDAVPVPLHLGFTVRDLPLVCTSPEYFEQRGLACSNGHVPHAIRQVVLGSKAAAQLGAAVGGRLHSDPAAGFGLAGAPAQSLEVVGILEATHGPDDRAIFASVQTAWLLQGDLHGHAGPADLREDRPDLVLAEREGGMILSGAVVPDQDSTADRPVHLHGDVGALPISAILLWPSSDKARTLLQTEVETEGRVAILRPTTVVRDLLRYTLRLKTLIDRLVWFLGLGMLALFLLVTALSSQMRSKEWITLRRLGTPPGTVAKVLLMEAGMITGAALALAALGTLLTIQFLPNLVHAI